MKNYNFKGENNNYCKLSDADVGLIKQIAESKKLSYRKIAAMFGVTHSHVYKIVKGKTRA
jgi:predicted XRE-type DNA-binding protein